MCSKFALQRDRAGFVPLLTTRGISPKVYSPYVYHIFLPKTPGKASTRRRSSEGFAPRNTVNAKEWAGRFPCVVWRASSTHPRSFVGVSQSQFFRDLVNFWRLMPTKWLQERRDGSKNEDGIPPHRALCGQWALRKRFGPHIRLNSLLRCDLFMDDL